MTLEEDIRNLMQNRNLHDAGLVDAIVEIVNAHKETETMEEWRKRKLEENRR